MISLSEPTALFPSGCEAVGCIARIGQDAPLPCLINAAKAKNNKVGRTFNSRAAHSLPAVISCNQGSEKEMIDENDDFDKGGDEKWTLVMT